MYKRQGPGRACLALTAWLGACGAAPAPGAGASGTAGASGSSGTGAGPSTGGAPMDVASDDLPPACAGLDALELVERDFVAPGQARAGVSLAPCTRDLWWTAAPAASAQAVRVTSEVPVRVEVRYPDGPGAVEPALAEAEGTGTIEAVLYAPRSGEFAVTVRPLDTSTSATYDISVTCRAGCTLETTRFPILFVHGWTGFSAIGPVDYFYGVRDDLEPLGYPLRFPVLDPYNSHVVRAAQLASAIDDALIELRARKVDIVAHSQGGLDSRYLISSLGYGDRVAALTTVATPHRGTPLADIALGLQPGPSATALAFLLETIGATGGFDSDAQASFESLSEAFVQGTFNPQNPNDARVDYQSWMGRTCLSVATCGDVVDAPILTGYQILTSVSGDNDGVVPVASAPWGEYHGTVPADHFDEVGQIAGATSPAFDHLAFYRARARDLRDAAH